MKVVIRLTIVAVGLTAGSMFGVAAARASGDAPWCAVTQIGEGAEGWNCQYQTVNECAPNVIAGNRGSCTPNPYYSPAAATASVPGQGHANITSSTVESRKSKKNAK